MEKIIFCDAITGISITNGVVRINLAIQDSTQGPEEEGRVTLKNEMSLVMPLVGFLFSTNIIAGAMNDQRTQDLLKRMGDAGLLPQQQEAEPSIKEAKESKKN